GSLSLSNTTIASNTISGGSGGGIWFFGSSLALTNVHVLSNTASLGGGGLASEGPTTVTNSLFDNNVSLNTDNNPIHAGGGILALRQLTLLNSIVSNNKALGASQGGGIAMYGGSLQLERSR